ncbi:hypothetical protein C8Q77DRAFT_291306 [Trametes polyzona]|nr:hypothetical protein C8Q77DRAFT_291306 [Trametes polyzona]
MKSFCPVPQYFAVMQMDPVGMVKQYHDDPIALAQARAIRPKKYLVYLLLPMELSTPTKPWFRYEVWPIATTLRPEDKEKGITSDMVVPIYPNTSHPKGRPPVPTDTPFPFPNCYFWIDSGVVVRIRRNAIRYEFSDTPAISALEDIRLPGRFIEDRLRMAAFRRNREEALDQAAFTHDTLTHQSRSSSSSGTDDRCSPDGDVVSLLDNDTDSLPEGSGANDQCGDNEATSTRPSNVNEDDPAANSEIATLLKLDYFSSNDDDAIGLIPLVDLWFDIADQLTPDTIPSPVDFFKERAEIMRIIHDARERAPSPRWPLTESPIPIDFDALSYCKPSDETRGEESKRLRRLRAGTTCISRAWRNLRRAAERTLTARIPWRVRPPYLPFWP